MKDQRADALARVLVNYSADIQPGEVVVVRAPAAAEPIVASVYEEVLRAGGKPVVQMSFEGQRSSLMRLASDEQLEWVPPPARWMAEEADASITVLATTNSHELSQIDPQRQAQMQRAMQPLMAKSMKRAADGDYKWSLTMFPTNAYASQAEMSLSEYEDFYYGACFCDRKDPVAAWREHGETSRRLKDWTEGHEEVHIQGEGTDLKLGIAGRKFIACEGDRNMPDGEFFTGPIEDATEGHVTFTYPAIYAGREVSGVRLEFREGKVVDATAERNEAFLHEMLDADAGARTLGELGIGTNYGIDRFTKEILLDEKIGGTIHLAVGASYPETGASNESAIHWDMVCDLRRGGKVTVDGRDLQVDGKFVV